MGYQPQNDLRPGVPLFVDFGASNIAPKVEAPPDSGSIWRRGGYLPGPPRPPEWLDPGIEIRNGPGILSLVGFTGSLVGIASVAYVVSWFLR